MFFSFFILSTHGKNIMLTMTLDHTGKTATVVTDITPAPHSLLDTLPSHIFPSPVTISPLPLFAGFRPVPLRGRKPS